jgi:hypothetical protein
MRKCRVIFTVILLTLASMNVMAEWTYISSNNDVDYYVDKTEIRKEGNMVKMWELVDYKLPQKNSAVATYLSARTYSEYDCNEARARIKELSSFRDNMLKGELLETVQGEGKWSYIPPDTVFKDLWEIACGKK